MAFPIAPLFYGIGNLYHIAVIVYEKRPVKMSPKDRELYETMFKSMSPVEYLKITKLAKWKKFKVGDEIITQSFTGTKR